MGVRKIKANDRSVTGQFHSDKMDELVHFESSLEQDFYLLCEFNSNVSEYIYQPLEIQYTKVNNLRSTYTPDVLIKYYNSDVPCLVEIKYRNDLRENFALYKPKFRAAIDYCKEQGWEFRIITESIRTPTLQNIKFLLSFRKKSLNVDEELLEQLLSEMNNLRSFTPQSFMEHYARTEYMKGLVLKYIWILALRRDIICDLTRPLTMNTKFYLSVENYEKYKY